MIEEIITLCKERGWTFGSLASYNDKFIVMAHDPKIAGREPIFSEKRDYLDYKFAMDSWKRRGLIVLSQEATPTKALEKAIEYLEQC